MSDLAKFLLDQGGVWGAIAVALAGACLYLERNRQKVQAQLEAEHAARLQDAKENTKALLEIAQQTNEALDKLQSLAPPPMHRR